MSDKPTNSRKRKTTDDAVIEEALAVATATANTSSSSSSSNGAANAVGKDGSNKPARSSSGSSSGGGNGSSGSGGASGNHGKDGKEGTEKAKNYNVKKDRLKKFKVAEEYVSFVGELMYPKKSFGPYGYHPEKSRFPVERMTTLGYLLSPLRPRTVFEKWSPIEIALFEASLTLFGKAFHRVQKYVKTKTTKEVIEFYYEWKKTNHYKQWKKAYIPDEREVPVIAAD